MLLWGTGTFHKVCEALKGNASVAMLCVISLVYLFAKLDTSAEVLLSLTAMSIMILWALGIFEILNKWRHGQKCALFLLLSVSLIVPELVYSDVLHTMKGTITISNSGTLKIMKLGPSNSCTKKLAACFSDADLLVAKQYKMVEEIRVLTRESRKDWCVFIAPDCYLSELYPCFGDDSIPYGVKAAFAATSLFGLPVINAFHSKDKIIYRWDGKKNRD